MTNQVQKCISTQDENSLKYMKRIQQADRVEWYLDGKLHNTTGPAVVYNDGAKKWYNHGKRHRIDVRQLNGHQAIRPGIIMMYYIILPDQRL